MSHIYKLKFPFQYGSENVTEIEIARPKAVHMRGIGDLETVDGTLLLLQKLIGKPPSFVDEIEYFDINAMSGIVRSFLQNGQAPENV